MDINIPLFCPFCGSTEVILDYEPAKYEEDECDPYIQCLNCGIRTDPNRHHMDSDALRTWNRRHDPDTMPNWLYLILHGNLEMLQYIQNKGEDEKKAIDTINWVLQLKKSTGTYYEQVPGWYATLLEKLEDQSYAHLYNKTDVYIEGYKAAIKHMRTLCGTVAKSQLI